jgi:hypothetical protein
MKQRTAKNYKGCTIVPESGEPKYFGHNPRIHQRNWWKVTFPDQTWCLFATLPASREYVRKNLADHGAEQTVVEVVLPHSEAPTVTIMENEVKQRLEYLRGELRAERISLGELCELADLAPHIEPGDVELLEAAGVPEFSKENPCPAYDALDSFTRGYIVASLWSTNDESTPAGGVPLDDNYDHHDISNKTLAAMEADCEKFQNDNADDLALAYDLYIVTDGTDPQSYAGHDFWLSRNGHGANFLDRNELWKHLRDRLQKAAEAMGGVNLYVGDDKRIYAM